MSQMVLGFDPGWAKPTAYAIGNAEGLVVELGFLPPGKDMEAGHVITTFDKSPNFKLVQHVYIELGHAGNTTVMQQMAITAGALRCCFRPLLPVTFTPYGEWSSSFGIRPGTNKKDAHQRYMNIAAYFRKDLEKLPFTKKMIEDLAAAICIAVFGSRRLG